MNAASLSSPRKVVIGLVAAVLLGFAVLGAACAFRWCRDCLVRRHAPQEQAARQPPAAWIPASKLPGPPRSIAPARFALSSTNALAMTGMDDAVNERWCDIAGNYYSGAFIADYSYEGRGARQPQVLVHVEQQNETLHGRLEARRLKPNFAYQVKLRGVFADRRSFEAIGHVGRWRLPGRGTNYTDADYDAFPDKASVEAYVLFDYFVTDRNGNAIRDFALDSSLHVLWNAARQAGEPEAGDLTRVVVLADDPAVYSRPKQRATMEWLWAEREVGRYTTADERIALPEGDYRAELVLTEESFHSVDSDGGFWATVYRCPIAFTITR